MPRIDPLEDALKSEVSATVETVAAGPPFDHDSHHLARSGKRQVLKRRFGGLAMTCFACVALVSWETAMGNIGIGLRNGGPAGIIYGIILNCVGMGTVYSSLSELASMSPTAAGQYHWAAFLAPRKYRVIFSYLTAWMTVLTWITICTATAYNPAAALQIIIKMTHPSYEPQRYQATLIMLAILVFSFFVNTSIGRYLPKIEFFFFIIHTIGFFAFVIPIANLGPEGSVTEVFTRFDNLGGFATDGLSFMVGLQGTVIVFAGFDCIVHMSEEITNARRAVPIAMMGSFILNAVMAFAIVILFLLRAGNFDELEASSNPYTYIDITRVATGSPGATVTFTAYTIFMSIACCISSVAAGSRMIWSFARDRGFPLWFHIQQIQKHTRLPVKATSVICVLSAILGLIQIGSEVVFFALTSLAVAGFCSSYLIVLAPLLYHRIRGTIVEPIPGRDDRMYEKPDGERHLVWGCYQIKGIWGILNNAFACAYLVVSIFFSFWPTVMNPTAETFNFSVVIYVGVLLICAIYYGLYARKTFKGPVIEIVLT